MTGTEQKYNDIQTYNNAQLGPSSGAVACAFRAPSRPHLPQRVLLQTHICCSNPQEHPHSRGRHRAVMPDHGPRWRGMEGGFGGGGITSITSQHSTGSSKLHGPVPALLGKGGGGAGGGGGSKQRGTRRRKGGLQHTNVKLVGVLCGSGGYSGGGGDPLITITITIYPFD